MIGLHAGRWRIPDSKTDAGVRDVELTAYTLAELRARVIQRQRVDHELVWQLMLRRRRRALAGRPPPRV